jgi:hypothetical protein
MKIIVPYRIGDRVMTSGRVFSYISSIEGTIYDNGEVKYISYDTTSVNRVRPVDIKGHADILIEDYNELDFDAPYKIGQEILYQNSTYGNVGILSKGVITGIQFNLSKHGNLFWYHVNGKANITRYEIYTDKNDFINRTKPKALLLEGQRYAFSEYCIQQNNLIAVTVEK